MPLLNLTAPCTELPGVGEKLAEKLKKCGIETIENLLFHLPYRYQDRTRLTPIAWLKEKSWAVVEGIISHCEVKQGRRRSLVVSLSDKSGVIQLRFFNFNQGLRQTLAPDRRIRCFGQVRFIRAQAEMAHPEFSLIEESKNIELAETMTPIYSTTQGLTQAKIRLLIHYALNHVQSDNFEHLPTDLCKQYHLGGLNEAIHYLHAPPPDANTQSLEAGTHPLQQRLSFEELLAHQLSAIRLKNQAQAHNARPLLTDEIQKQKLINKLPFSLTEAQKRVINEIEEDIKKTHPMQRLVQGDVGSGKTIVAAIACLAAVSQNHQAAFMAPTELLAEQHAKNLIDWLQPLNIQVCLLLGKHSAKEKKEILSAIANNEAKVIVGTHALFQEKTHFASLGLVIIDEQHRFGVNQRLSLQEKGNRQNSWPHLLFMTATPIPRTLAMTQFAHLDISIIDELPPGRTPVKTVAIDNSKREEVILRLKQILSQQKQAYWICTLIEESEVLQCQTAQDTAELLNKELAPFKVGLVHGRMKAEEKLQIMQSFKENQLDVLVATTVIEVGVDVPNSTIMIIENAERLGLFQLHQLRGRVGRGSEQSHCVLLFQSPLSHIAKERLNLLRQTTNGFEIAQADLKIRGGGQIFGTRQTGQINYRIADPYRDAGLLPQVKKLAEEIFKQPLIYQKLITRWLGDGEKYLKS